jgi:hypothetical protein
MAKLAPEQIEQRLEPLTRYERVLAGKLERKDAIELSDALSELTGKSLAKIIFGVGVLGMVLSSITLLMLISGFVISEMLGLPPKGWPHRLGCLAATTGVLGPFLLPEQARFWLVVPTSVFCFTLLPFAYLTFLLAMNSRSLLGEEMPAGGRRAAWNLGMGLAASVATAASVYTVWSKAKAWFFDSWGWEYGGYVGLSFVGSLALLVIVVHLKRRKAAATAQRD